LLYQLNENFQGDQCLDKHEQKFLFLWEIMQPVVIVADDFIWRKMLTRCDSLVLALFVGV